MIATNRKRVQKASKRKKKGYHWMAKCLDSTGLDSTVREDIYTFSDTTKSVCENERSCPVGEVIETLWLVLTSDYNNVSSQRKRERERQTGRKRM